VPLDLNIPEVANFANKLKELDSIMSSPEMIEKLFGKKAKKYKYLSIYKESQLIEYDSDDDTDKKKINEPKPPYLKLKLKLSYPDKKIESLVFESEKDLETKKITREKVNVTTIDEFTSYVRYKSDIRCIIKPFKIWAHPLTKKDPEFGISFRLEKVEVYKSSKPYKSTLDSDNFIDSDDEEIPKVSNIKLKEDSSNNSDDDSSVEEEIIGKTQIAEVDSDSDSDEEVITKPVETVTKKTIEKVTTKVIETVNSDDSDDSDEEVVIAKPPVKAKKSIKSKK
jgi:hypothetical protein